MNAHSLLHGKNATASSPLRSAAVLLVLTVSIALSHPANAQTPAADSAAADTTREYIELESGERIYGSFVLKNFRPHGRMFLVNDSLVYEQRVVRGYYNDAGYHRRTDDDKWAQLVSDEGRLHLWARSEWRSGMPLTTFGPNGTMQPVMTFPQYVKTDYFSTEDGPVQKVSYGNLKPVLEGHPESMQHLKQYRTLRTMQWVLAGVGAAIFLGSATQASGDNGIPTGVYIGGGIALSSWIPHLARQGKLRQAIDTYNSHPGER